MPAPYSTPGLPVVVVVVGGRRVEGDIALLCFLQYLSWHYVVNSKHFVVGYGEMGKRKHTRRLLNKGAH